MRRRRKRKSCLQLFGTESLSTATSTDCKFQLLSAVASFVVLLTVPSNTTPRRPLARPAACFTFASSITGPPSQVERHILRLEQNDRDAPFNFPLPPMVTTPRRAEVDSELTYLRDRFGLRLYRASWNLKTRYLVRNASVTPSLVHWAMRYRAGTGWNPRMYNKLQLNSELEATSSKHISKAMGIMRM